jgi:hypothetical protein
VEVTESKYANKATVSSHRRTIRRHERHRSGAVDDSLNWNAWNKRAPYARARKRVVDVSENVLQDFTCATSGVYSIGLD